MNPPAETDTRALDAWLAEHLFGWVWVQHGAGLRRGNSQTPYQRFLADPRQDPGHHFFEPAPNDMPLTEHYWDACEPYSSTGDGMLQVLEAMRERGDWCLSPDGDGWVAVLTDGIYGDNQPHYSGRADTLPLAVATAAKAALEAKVESR